MNVNEADNFYNEFKSIFSKHIKDLEITDNIKISKNIKNSDLRGDVLILSIRNSTKGIIFKKEYTLSKWNMKDAIDSIDTFISETLRPIILKQSGR